MRDFRNALCILCIVTAFSSPVLAQSAGLGAISGQVLDPTEAVIRGAAVTLTSLDRGFQRQIQTDENGNFVFQFLVPGAYSINVAMRGFSTARKADIRLTAAETVFLPFVLQVGLPETVITVSADPGILDIDTAVVHASIPETAIREMPVITGSMSRIALSQLQLLLPGASLLGYGLSDSYGNLLSINGSAIGGIGFSLDGVENSYLLGSIGGSTTTGPNPDALEEISVFSQNYKAESGGHQATVMMRTRSGTNRFRGNARVLHLNPALSTRDFFSTAANTSSYRTTMAGFNAGGPLVLPHLYDGRNRTFAFFDTEWISSPAHAVSSAVFPGDAERSGDFSALPQSSWPRDPVTGQPFAGGRIPAGRILPQARFFVDHFIPPDTTGGAVTLLSEDRPLGLQFTTRVDHSLGSNDMLNGSLYFYRNADIYNNPRTFGFKMQSGELGSNISAQYVHHFSAAATNAFSFGGNRWRGGAMPIGDFLNVNLIDEGYNIHNVTGAPQSYPNVYMDSNRYEPSGYPYSETSRTFQWKDDLSILRGAHSWKLGGDLRYATELWADYTWGAPTFSFKSYNPSGTGNDLADLLLGIPYSYSQSTDPIIRARRLLASLYIQDDYRLHSGLTLNLGLRYEMNGRYASQDVQVGVFHPGSQSTVFPNAPANVLFTGDFDPLLGNTIGDSVIPPDHANFAPRAGIAWSPGFRKGLASRLFGGPGRTSIRAGYGIYHMLGLGSAVFSLPYIQPWFYSISVSRSQLDASGGNMTNPWGNGVDPFTTAVAERKFFPLLQNEYCLDPALRSPYQYQWTLSIERQIGKELVVEAAYVGNRSLHLLRQLEANPGIVAAGATNGNVQARRAYQDFPGVPEYVSDGRSIYNGLQIGMSRRFSRIMMFDAHYTWSKTLDNASGNSWSALANPLTTPWGRANSDRTHNFAGYGVLNIPAPVRAPWLKMALAGWKLSGAVQLRTGPPIQIRNPYDSTLQGLPAGMPDMIGTYRSFNPRQVQQFTLPNGRTFTGNFFFDPAAFKPVLPKDWIGARIGNLGRNVFSGPATANVDLSLCREFRITERHRLELRAEATNAFNHAQFTAPNGGLNGNMFGRISSTTGPRRVQFQLRFGF